MPKPSLVQCVLCVVAILGLQAFLTWLDNDGPQTLLAWFHNIPIEDLRFVVLAMPLTLIAGWIARRMRGGAR